MRDMTVEKEGIGHHYLQPLDKEQVNKAKNNNKEQHNARPFSHTEIDQKNGHSQGGAHKKPQNAGQGDVDGGNGGAEQAPYKRFP